VASVWSRLRDRIGVGPLLIGGIIVAALAFIAVSVVHDLRTSTVDIAAGSRFPCTVVSVYDGDGPINCAEVDAEGKQVRVRVKGIEARDSDNTCRLADRCPSASGAEAKAALTRLAVGRIECVSHGPSYNRVDAFCVNAQGQDVSCEMLRTGTAVRWAEYDPEGRLANCTPSRR